MSIEEIKQAYFNSVGLCTALGFALCVACGIIGYFVGKWEAKKV